MLKYEEIVSYIEEQIENQTFIPNMKLPSLREMAGHFSTSVGTVLSAYKYLEQRHKIYSQERLLYRGNHGQPWLQEKLHD